MLLAQQRHEMRLIDAPVYPVLLTQAVALYGGEEIYLHGLPYCQFV